LNPFCVENSPDCRTFLSDDKLGEVDDPRDVISEMLSEEILNEATSKEAPPHSLKLAVDDVCFVYFISQRSFGKEYARTYLSSETIWHQGSDLMR